VLFQHLKTSFANFSLELWRPALEQVELDVHKRVLRLSLPNVIRVETVRTALKVDDVDPGCVGQNLVQVGKKSAKLDGLVNVVGIFERYLRHLRYVLQLFTIKHFYRTQIERIADNPWIDIDSRAVENKKNL
jgi:hypothetical protein